MEALAKKDKEFLTYIDNENEEFLRMVRGHLESEKLALKQNIFRLKNWKEYVHLKMTLISWGINNE